ncbi:hypothetical protein FHL15_000691 [Xylaria flabelliformis]|uniref:Uncharacterized protein n=1 Tax=Xylaria flabelliformis TaxID=2512241 RepID=A0A553IEL1_9PEZI|nr:hypothetical protein FHL15_000691 [Xylaria flabelliformis]
MAQEQTILPKGIVLNRNTVYEEIAKYDVVPVERILRACHVFSTTSRELYDPTARRLENFWTRVLGGDRRYLSGKVIARLFQDISEETSFVKLRGPQNRYEPPSPKSIASKSQIIQATASTPTMKLESKPTTSAKTPHPILKKPRGPSASGPRPTARFVSPPESEIDEDNTKQSGTTTLSTAATYGVGSKAPGGSGGANTNEERRKGNSHRPKKKTAAFVASTSSKRRPGMPRRSSSQSSAGNSEVATKDGDSSLGSKYDGSQSSVPTILEKPERQQVAKKGDGNTGLSAKAAGKRPMTQSRAEITTSKAGTARNSQLQNEGSSAGQGNVKVKGNPGKTGGTADKRSKMSSSAAVQKPDIQQPPSESTPSLNRSASDTGSIRPISREASRTFVAPSSLMSLSQAKLDTSVVGQGTISKFAESTPSRGPYVGQYRENCSNEAPEASQSYSGSGIGRQMTPTQPSSTPTIPLGRSKSQLAILLDRKAEKKPTR